MSRCGHREERNIYWAEWRKIMVLGNVWLSFIYGTMRSYISYQAPMSVTKEKWKKRWVSFLGRSSNLTTSNSNSLLCLTPHPGLFWRNCSREHSTINYLHIRVCFSWNLTGDIELSISSGRAGQVTSLLCKYCFHIPRGFSSLPHTLGSGCGGLC